MDAGLRVRAHVARANPIWRAAPCPAMLIVSPDDAYVSPGFYPSKRRDPKVVPTWNYELVHVHGTLQARPDPAWLEALVRELTVRNEATMAEPWAVDDAPADFIERMLRAIVGIELEVTRVEAKRKLSQNRSAEDVAGVVAGLAGGDDRSAAVARGDGRRHRHRRDLSADARFAHLAPGGRRKVRERAVGWGLA